MPRFWTSGHISLGFQSQGASSPDCNGFTCGTTLLMASIAAEPKQALVGLKPGIDSNFHFFSTNRSSRQISIELLS